MPPAFPGRSASHASPVPRPYNPGRPLRPPVWAPPRSLAATWGIISYFLLLRVLRCFSSPRVPPLCGYHMSPYGGLPHSEIPGSKVICTSPGLIAAYHVLRRRQEPGHPLCALSNLLVSTRFDFFFFAPGFGLPSAGRQLLLLPVCQRTSRDQLPYVEDNGFEPMTPCVQSRCSSQLS